MTVRVLGLVALSMMIGLRAAQSLREQARANGGKAENSMHAIIPVIKPPELLDKSDLVLYCRVVGSTPRLSKDESIVVTDYEVVPLRIVKQTAGISSSSKPGALPKLVVRRVGGTMLEGSYQYSTVYDNFPEDALRSGDDAVLFLMYSTDERVFLLTTGLFSVFRVADGRVGAGTAEATAALRRDGTPVDLKAFLDDLESRSRKKR